MNLVESKLKEYYSGVYALYNKGVCVYVGQSQNVPYRLRQHIKDQEKEFDDFEVFYTLAPSYLEAFLIREIRPFYNILINPSKKTVSKPDPTHTRLLRLVKKYCKENECHKISELSIYSITCKKIFPNE